MRILHVLDHGLPLHSGYAFRTRAIVKAQMGRGWEVACLTGARQGATEAPVEQIDGITFFRTPPPAPPRAGAGGPPPARARAGAAGGAGRTARRHPILPPRAARADALADLRVARDRRA